MVVGLFYLNMLPVKKSENCPVTTVFSPFKHEF